MYKQTKKLFSYIKLLQIKPITMAIMIMLVYPMSCSKKKIETPTPKIEAQQTPTKVQQGVFKVETHSVQLTTKKTDSTSIATRTGGEITTCIVDGMIVDDLSNPLCQCDICPGGEPGDDIGQIPNLPDLTPSSITVSPSSILTGETLNFSIIIRNQGGIDFDENGFETISGVPGEGVRVNIHVLKETENGLNASNLAFQGIFDPRVFDENDNIYLLSSSFTLLPEMVTPGLKHRLAVVVNPNCSMPELSCSNNGAADNDFFTVASEVDLVINYFRDSFTPETLPRLGKSFIKYHLKNAGTGILRKSTTLKIKYTAIPVIANGDLANPIHHKMLFVENYQVLNDIPPDGAALILKPNVSIDLVPGRYALQVTLDSENNIEETGSDDAETNNSNIIGYFTITPKVDLSITPIAVATGSVTRCTSGFYKFKIENKGDISFNGSVDVIITPRFSSVELTALRGLRLNLTPGQSKEITLSSNHTILPGAYNMTAVLDSHVEESLDGNNEYRWDMAIEDLALCQDLTDLTISNLTVDVKPSILAYVMETNALQIKNIGSTYTYPCEVSYILSYSSTTGGKTRVLSELSIYTLEPNESVSIPSQVFFFPRDYVSGTYMTLEVFVDKKHQNLERNILNNVQRVHFIPF